MSDAQQATSPAAHFCTDCLRTDPLEQAREQVQQAYAAARQGVYDRYPHGLPSWSQLSLPERHLLRDLDQAEADLDHLRRRRATAFGDAGGTAGTVPSPRDGWTEATG
jgi:hypothetical protein